MRGIVAAPATRFGSISRLSSTTKTQRHKESRINRQRLSLCLCVFVVDDEANRSIQPHQFGRVVMEHDADLVLFDTEGEEGADEDSHSIDAVHVQDLAEVASDDAA